MNSTKMEVANQNFTFGSSLLNNAATSSSALAVLCGANVANRASEGQTEGPAVDGLSLGTVNDKDPDSTGRSTEATKVYPQVVGAVFSSEHNGVWVGEHFCRYQGAYRHSYEEHAKIHLLERLHVIEDDETKSERPRSDSGYLKKEHDLKKERDDLKRKHEVFDKSLMLRQAYSDFEKTQEFEDMNIEIKQEVLKLLKRLTGKNENFEMIVRKNFYTKILRTMLVQKVNLALKGCFRDTAWRNHYFFPKFHNYDPDYKWWEQNYVPETLEKRLEILREAARNWNSEQDIYMVIELVTDLNATLHPRKSGEERVEMFSLATTICSLRSGGNSKI